MSDRSKSTRETAIEVRGARTHNLKGIDCRVPHGKVTVVTGPSGAGKSSLAFDTVFAEGQRRFVESMSTYARQFLDQMERPPVEAVDNVLPAVALEAKNAVKNARSTVGTITEAHDVLRLLFTHLGEVGCPRGHGPARSFTAPTPAIELLEPQGETGRTAEWLREKGESIWHICLEVDDIEAALAELRAKDVKLLDEMPRTGHGGHRIAFIDPASTAGILIELVEMAGAH